MVDRRDPGAAYESIRLPTTSAVPGTESRGVLLHVRVVVDVAAVAPDVEAVATGPVPTHAVDVTRLDGDQGCAQCCDEIGAVMLSTTIRPRFQPRVPEGVGAVDGAGPSAGIDETAACVVVGSGGCGGSCGPLALQLGGASALPLRLLGLPPPSTGPGTRRSPRRVRSSDQPLPLTVARRGPPVGRRVGWSSPDNAA